MPKLTVVLGSQWGDEGKGKLVDILSEQADIVARCNGGSNAGHTVVVGDKKYAFHLLPSGILHQAATCVIGNGVVLHLPTLFEEMKKLKVAGISYNGRILLSDRAHLVLDYHQLVDGQKESAMGDKKIGTTKRGIGPAYSQKMDRVGLRVGDLRDFDTFAGRVRANFERYDRVTKLDHDLEKELAWYKDHSEAVKEMTIDSVDWLNKAYSDGRRILVEGANGTLLDIDFGTYPFVTSSNTTIGATCTGLGLSWDKIGDVVGIVKAYTTRVGSGPFPTELTDALGDQIRDRGGEFGTTTGRPRRCGWLDTFLLRYATRLNGFTALNLTKLDVLTGISILKIAIGYALDGVELTSFPSRLEDLERVELTYEEVPGWTEDIVGVRTFEELPENAQKYILRIEELVGVKVLWIGVGQARDAMIER